MARATEDPPDELIATVIDPKGRTVQIMDWSWEHIQVQHPEVRLENVKQAIQTAEKRTRKPTDPPGFEKLWARNLPPAKWLTVAVAYDEKSLGTVKTAIPSRDDPRKRELI